MNEIQENSLFTGPIKVINLGLIGFFESLEVQEIEVVQVDWEPPAGGDSEMIDILDSLL